MPAARGGGAMMPSMANGRLTWLRIVAVCRIGIWGFGICTSVFVGCRSTIPASGAVVVETSAAMRSAALDTESAITRIAFGSCYVPQFEEAEIWRTIAQSKPDVFLFMGDNVYQSEEKAEPELLELREAYGLLANDEPFAQLRSQIPVLPTWDDHDYGLNDAGAELPVRYESEALFEQVWAIAPDDPRRSRDGIYHSVVVGPSGQRAQLILLDTRFFRTTETMLGLEQWNWLEETLAEPADLRVLVSSIPVLSQRPEGESWHRWQDERLRLLSMLDGAAGTTILLSGDSHFGSFYTAENDHRVLWEVTSSSLNFPMPEKARLAFDHEDRARVGAVYFDANFGWLAVDWPERLLSLELRDVSGQSVATQRIPLSE